MANGEAEAAEAVEEAVAKAEDEADEVDATVVVPWTIGGANAPRIPTKEEPHPEEPCSSKEELDRLTTPTSNKCKEANSSGVVRLTS